MEELFAKTGIQNFDDFFEHGGYPRKKSIVIMGGPGAGKSIFGMQYIYKGAAEYGEPGVYVTLEEPPQEIRENMVLFGWDLQQLEDEKKVVIIDAVSGRTGSIGKEKYTVLGGFDIDSMLKQIQRVIQQTDAKRLVIDSLSIMEMYAKDPSEIRTKLLQLSHTLSALDVTSLLLTEARRTNVGIDDFPSESFVFDGVITLVLDTKSQDRKVAIRKMRGTKHVLGSFKFQITESGISVSP